MSLREPDPAGSQRRSRCAEHWEQRTLRPRHVVPRQRGHAGRPGAWNNFNSSPNGTLRLGNNSGVWVQLTANNGKVVGNFSNIVVDPGTRRTSRIRSRLVRRQRLHSPYKNYLSQCTESSSTAATLASPGRQPHPGRRRIRRLRQGPEPSDHGADGSMIVAASNARSIGFASLSETIPAAAATSLPA